MTNLLRACRTFILRSRSLSSLLLIGLAMSTIMFAGCSEGLVSSDATRSDVALTDDGVTIVAKAARSTSPVYTFPGGPDQVLIEGASASLTRTKNGVNYRFATNSLEAGHAYTLWVVIFNEPANCGTAPDTCTAIDLFDNDAKPDMLYGAGLVVGGSGKAIFAGRTKVGDASGSVQALAGLDSNGLLDPFGAEIHFVVHHHGPKIPAFMPDMIQTLAGGCQDAGIPETGAPSPWNDYASSPDYAGEYGELGPNECLSVQFSILTP